MRNSIQSKAIAYTSTLNWAYLVRNNGMLGDLLQSIAGNPWVTPKMEIKREDINLHIITATLGTLSAWKHVVKEHVMKAEERV